MKWRLGLCARLVAISVYAYALSPDVAWAYSCISSACGGYCQSPVPYRLGTPSADLGLATTETELKTGMEAWTKPACSSLKVQYGGTTSDAPGNGNGVVAWAESSWSSGNGTIGVTTSRLSRGCLTAHMLMNGVNFKWVSGTPAGRGQVNAFTIIAHEGGHFLGLGHSTASGAVMRAQYPGGVVPLNQDDEAGICKIYSGGGGTAVPGGGGAGGSTGQNTGGTGGSSGSGKGQLCAACQMAADCASGVCVRNNLTGERFCGQSCGTGCPSGFRCAAVQGAANQCLPPNNTCSNVNVPDGTAAGGAAGGGGAGGAGAGGAGAGGSDGANQGGTGGMSAAECQNDADCEDNQRCIGARCMADDEGQLIRPDGESCAVNEDCQSRLCVEADGKEAFCSRACTGNADCVSGFACRDHGDDKICLPIEGEMPAEDDKTEDNKASSGCAVASGQRNGGPACMLSLVTLCLLALRRKRPSQR
ncbi:MAG: matrixin family metalloprotease [Deltaproteobacteria bacterium]|nr:matrixin family metalloprotease [Deltaproteobacteria bacterium]